MATTKTDEIVDLSAYMALSDEEIEELTSNSLAPANGVKNYYFKIKDFEVKEWEDGKRNLNLTTEVTRGDKKGWNGPFMNLGLSPYIDRDAEQPDEEQLAKMVKAQAVRFIQRLQKITNSAAIALPAATEQEVLQAAGEIIKGCEFVAGVKRGPKGYAQFSNYYSLDAAPADAGEVRVEAFSI